MSVSAPNADPPADLVAAYAGRRCMVAGGLGFIGSNLAIRLVDLGARVLIVDSLIPAYGGNFFNVAGIRDRVHVNVADVRDPHAMEYLVRGQDFIFNLAGQIGHLESMEAPIDDLRVNTEGPVNVLEACRRVNRDARILYASTRQVYGRPLYLPVDEAHPLQPIDCNAVSNLAGEQYHRVYAAAHGIRSTCLRLTNTYGPRQMMKDETGRYAFISYWIRRVIDRLPLQVMGGTQGRDYTFIDDCVEAMLLAAAGATTASVTYNLGGEPMSHLALADLLIDVAGGGSIELTELPDERRAIDPGVIALDHARITDALGWRPVTALRDGLASTVEYYRRHRDRYWNASDVAAQQAGVLQAF